METMTIFRIWGAHLESEPACLSKFIAIKLYQKHHKTWPLTGPPGNNITWSKGEYSMSQASLETYSTYCCVP